MQLTKFIITEEFLNSLKEDKKIFSVQLGYFLNELNVLYKCTRINPKAPVDTPEGMAEFCFTLMFIRLLASKLYEAWRFIKTWDKDNESKTLWARISHEVWRRIRVWNTNNKKQSFVDNELPKWLESLLLEETKKIWIQIDDYFKNTNNILVYIRNHAGFHYEKGLIKKGLQQLEVLKNTQGLTYFTSECDENSLFLYSEMIIFEGLKKQICKKNCQENCKETSPRICQKGKPMPLAKLIAETTKVFLLFHKFSMECLDKIAEPNKDKLKSVEIPLIPEPPTYKEIKFPFFIQRDEGE
jgi:hypothetical protein